ncbi:Eco57I restriction-modification methylase domain-containing protein [Rariglobus hedericola]|uniref:site-specific DNA-methyltransferase (adenine-specific) n=1 Tax=Rariglobus hedericola TaxID=2597822 RepID=A0A556QJD7_9BACT|nr:type IIL restriction-modification enzyme MmeI [Rariglobus hedericola]TSJ76756.1 TetR family transcriptional regulator [Rariglobus hedericola]
MSASQHITWLNLVEKTGPFLAVSVLDEAFPQGLEKVETRRRQRVRSAYDEWRDAVDAEDAELAALHREWVRLILEELLEYDAAMLRADDQLPATLVYREPMCGVEVRPTFAATTGDTARLLIAIYSPDCDLTAPLPGDAWITASPIERMTQLCRATGVRLGLVTNGERWSVVSVPSEGSSSVATWFARIWQQEPVTLQAFVSLLGVRRCFGPAAGTLETLLANSLNDQNEITDTLGEQVRRAVEVLVQALDKADAAQNRTLLTGVTPPQLYEAGVTVMMRLVVLLCAEQRGLLLLGVDTYDQYYAATTLRVGLEKEKKDLTDDVQERRHDAWARLLALCRGVFGGIEHATLRLPPLGGTLFDPDRFPFLEGRAAGSTWRETPAVPLPIDNRTVLTLLNALQVLEQTAGAQFLSYEALDVEQIGHVYEGLLERTVRRVPEVTVGLVGSAKAYNPNITLRELEEKAEEGRDLLLIFLQETTGRSESGLRKALDRSADEAVRHRLAMACGTRTKLVPKLLPFANLIREDTAKRLLIYDEGSYIVTLGDSRRDTGTHYTPKSLTEPIVQNTLEPLVYIGPVEETPREKWKLKSAPDLLSLKVCDMAMGSAAFLVQACRWLADRVMEAWDAAEKAGSRVSIDGKVLDQAGKDEPLPIIKGERVLIARRLVASRCLYGVDKNPMAVELAKVSLWLVTMQKGKPFSFLDHSFKCGDSLLGVTDLLQIENFSLRPKTRQVTFASANLLPFIKLAETKRCELENLPSNDYAQIKIKNLLHGEAEAAIAKVKMIADCLIGLELRCLDGNAYEEAREYEVEQVHAALHASAPAIYAQAKSHERSSFHWPVEFPEVFSRGGFDAFLGNPPYMHGRRISSRISDEYLAYLSTYHTQINSSSDLAVYFILRGYKLVKNGGAVGLITTQGVATGDSRESGLAWITSNGGSVYWATPDYLWPGAAAVRVCSFSILKQVSLLFGTFGSKRVDKINSYLTEATSDLLAPFSLLKNKDISATGTYVYGRGFVLSPEQRQHFIEADPRNTEFIFRFLRGQDINQDPEHRASAFVINFGEMPESEARKRPLIFDHLRRYVEPERAKQTKQVHEECFWKHWDKRPELYSRLKPLRRCMVHAFTSKHVVFAFVPTEQIIATPHVVFPTESMGFFANCQSSLHIEWVLRFSSKMKSDVRYTPSDCVQTFPFLGDAESLAMMGQSYYDYRREFMIAKNEGLTKTYNRFHNIAEQSADITRLRVLHMELDQAVAAAYGWQDLNLGHGFHLTKQGERYTLSEPARRTVLDRLLALNHQRYDEEVKAGLHDKKTGKKKSATSASRKLDATIEQGQGELL